MNREQARILAGQTAADGSGSEKELEFRPAEPRSRW